MKASIVISVSSSKILFDNFLLHLSKYENINDYEIIMVNDNADFLFTEESIREYNFTNVKVINLKNKLGYGEANNLAVDFASCDFLIFMNDDIILKKNCLNYLLDTLKNDNVGAVQPKLIYPQSNLIQSTGHVFTKYTNAHAFENISPDKDIVNKSGVRNALTTAVCATKKDLFLKMGKFDTLYYNAWEGMEYTLKLTIAGYKCMYEHNAEAYHIRGGARGMYSLDESSQSAIFWSRWSSKIDEDLHKYILSQLTEKEFKSNYLIINFSKITDIHQLLNKCSLQVSNIISYVYNSGLKHVDFLKCLPTKLCQSELDIIYLTNNFSQVKNNIMWFELRSNYNDLIIDLSGNVLKVNDILPNPSL